MSTLTGREGNATYKDLLQVSNGNAGIDATLRNVEDGEGTQSPLKLSTTAVEIPTLSATTSVMTPLIDSGAAVDLVLKRNAVTTLTLTTTGVTVGGGTVTTFVDSGSTSLLALKTNNGVTQFTVADVAAAVNNWEVIGAVTTGSPILRVVGSDTNIAGSITSKGTSSLNFYTDNLANLQFQVTRTSAANRNITITGSNGGNPTLATTAGSLAITPDTVFASTISIGTTPSTTDVIRVPYNSNMSARNGANSGNVGLIRIATQNSVQDVLFLGFSGSTGVIGIARSGAGAPGTADLPAGSWTVWRDTSGATTKVYYNNAGAIIASAAFA